MPADMVEQYVQRYMELREVTKPTHRQQSRMIDLEDALGMFGIDPDQLG